MVQLVEPVLNGAEGQGSKPRLSLKSAEDPGLSPFSMRQSMLYRCDTLPPGKDRPGESWIRRLHLCLRGLLASGAGRLQFSQTAKVFLSPCNCCIATNAYVTP